MIKEEDKERETLFKIVEGSADAIVCVDLKGIITYWNKGAEEFFGYKKGDITGQHFYKIVPDELRGEIEKIRREAIEKGFVKNYETYRTRKDGKKIPVSLTLTALKENGKVVAICGIFKDLSERKKLEEKLKESREEYKALFENANDAIAITDKEGRISLFNSKFSEMLGYERSELENLEFHGFIRGENGKSFEESEARHLLGKLESSISSFDLVKKDGSRIRAEISTSVLRRNNRIYALQHIIRDITEREKIANELREMKNHLEAILDAMQDAICVLDKDYNIVSCNKAFLKSLELKNAKLSQVLGEKCYAVLHGYGGAEHEKFCRERCIVKTAFETGEMVEDIHKHEDDGSTYHYSRVFPLKGEQGKERVVYLFSDFTEKKKAEEELKRKLEELEHITKLKQLFSDILTHDLINPLTVVKNTFEMLAESEKLGEKRELQMINKNIEKIREIIESTALFAKLEKKEDLNFGVVDLTAVLNEVIESLTHFADAKNMKISLKSPFSLPMKTSPFIEHVFLNLISNAIKYAPAGSEIEVHAEEDKNKVRVSVKDRGEGVPDAYKELIFERFKRLEKKGVKGTGLGLAIVKQIVEINSGRVWVENNPGGGSVFCVELPRS